jgi:hypothetical protein
MPASSTPANIIRFMVFALLMLETDGQSWAKPQRSALEANGRAGWLIKID